ncbi:sensor histidine kinase [Ramlibacter rhizophilus]|uniref:histidine kinase n=1 Tax=Ramlibacter rhizophilus TaxID=1781167 RepID=A0A4Z0BL32_9BURK|nr:sensor histidine kinase [Ramlibacter rhizophilus]
MVASLRWRLMLVLLAPLLSLALLSAWSGWRAAAQIDRLQDQRLARLLPLLADSVIPGEAGAPVLVMAPPLQQFLGTDGQTMTAFAVADLQGTVLAGHAWLAGLPRAGDAVDFRSEQGGGAIWRIARQQQVTRAGPMVLALADASDTRQQWVRAIWWEVTLPHLVIMSLAFAAMRWSLGCVTRPLRELTRIIEQRSAEDLGPIPDDASPKEVRPLIAALNRLFRLVDGQAEGQRRFISDASHQLRTPLAALQSQVEAWAHAGRRISPPGQLGTLLLPIEQIEMLRSATRRTSGLANQLLALSRADARSLRAEPTRPVNLVALCEGVLELHLERATDRGIDLGVELQPAMAQGYEWLLREALSNLVDNAIKYSPAGRAVTIRCGPLGMRGAFVEVDDEGIGIPADERARVLQRFYRVRGCEVEGTGLGLAIAEEIARAHGSQLDLQTGSSGHGLRIRMAFGG